MARCQVGGLQRDHGFVGFTEVEASAGLDDQHLEPIVSRQAPGVVATGNLERALGTAEAAFTISDQRK